MACGCLGIALLIAGWGFVVGGGWWLLASAALESPLPSWQQAFWFAAAGAAVGMMLGAQVGSKNALDEFDMPVSGPGARELAVDAGSRAAGWGSFVGAMIGGFVWFLVAQ